MKEVVRTWTLSNLHTIVHRAGLFPIPAYDCKRVSKSTVCTRSVPSRSVRLTVMRAPAPFSPDPSLSVSIVPATDESRVRLGPCPVCTSLSRSHRLALRHRGVNRDLFLGSTVNCLHPIELDRVTTELLFMARDFSAEPDRSVASLSDVAH